MSTQNNNKITVICANILDFVDDPAIAGESAHRYFEKGALVIQNGKVVNLGYEQDILPSIDKSATIIRHDGKLVMPGMIDTHIHLPQTEMVGAYGEQLLSWLTEYAFPTEKSLPVSIIQKTYRIVF